MSHETGSPEGLDTTLLRLVVDATRDAYVAVDGDGRITDWNPAAVVLFGWKRGEALGRALSEAIIPRRLRGDHGREVHRLIAGGAAPDSGRLVELRAIDRDGVEFAVALQVVSLASCAAGDSERAVEAHSDSRRTQDEATGVRALRAALDARERQTSTHSEATVSLAVRVARRLDLRSEEISAIEHVALLHDVGKIGIPDDILQKEGPLDEAEWQTMRRHPAIGAQIVASVTSLSHLAPAICAEHECWDGTGYPDGLAGDQIPVASRIVLACDALHAMTSARPYRKAMPMATALRGLRYHAGTQFDPAVVAALLDEVATGSTVSTPTPGDTKPSVLVIGDDTALGHALEHGLTSEGVSVRAATTATDAYIAVGDTCFDLIVLDWLLRGDVSGASACRRLRYLHPSGEIVVLSGLSDVRDQRAALEAGATAVLQEGIPLEVLVQRLLGIVRAR
jgi:PAS domain S-box-containing protein